MRELNDQWAGTFPTKEQAESMRDRMNQSSMGKVWTFYVVDRGEKFEIRKTRKRN